MPETQKIDDIIEAFSFIDDWEDRYRYLIELGRELAPLPDESRSSANKVEGCASQVWLVTDIDGEAPPRLRFRGDSDSHLVRGLVAILIALYSGRSAPEILATDVGAVLERLGLKEHLTPQRSNGVRSMVARIRAEAGRVVAPT